MGGALLQQVNRDTQQFALKCSGIWDGEKWNDIYKQPKTDAGKNSKRGLLRLVKTDKGYVTLKRDLNHPNETNLLETVFENGKLIRTQTFDEIRSIANSQ